MGVFRQNWSEISESNCAEVCAFIAYACIPTVADYYRLAPSFLPNVALAAARFANSCTQNADAPEMNTGTRLLSALLTGVNRARPFLPQEDPGIEGKISILFRVVHTSSFATATQALSLLFQVRATLREQVNDYMEDDIGVVTRGCRVVLSTESSQFFSAQKIGSPARLFTRPSKAT